LAGTLSPIDLAWLLRLRSHAIPKRHGWEVSHGPQIPDAREPVRGGRGRIRPPWARTAARTAPYRIAYQRRPRAVHDAWRRTFAQDFAQLGLIEGRDFSVEPLFAEGQLGRLPDLAAEHVRRGVDIIVALGGPAAAAAGRATTAIPVVFSIVTDPVALGLVDTAQRPGRNATGVTSLDPGQAEAQMQLLKEGGPRHRAGRHPQR
jgi:hypothetical protein